MNKTTGTKALLAGIKEKGKMALEPEEPLKDQITIDESSQESQKEDVKDFLDMDIDFTYPDSEIDNKEELSIKRSYTLRPSTVKKLEELKVFVYKDPKIKYNDIVDEAISFLYSMKKSKIKE